MLLYWKLALTLSSLFSVYFGLIRYLRNKHPLYFRMIVFGILCTMLGRAFELLQVFINGWITDGFHVGVLGIVGSFKFFFSANYGEMDMLADDKSARLRKYWLFALFAPAVILGIYAVYFAMKGFCEASVVKGCVALFISMASYYHLKHLIIPDVEDGLIRSIRGYNLIALVYAVLCMCEMLAERFGAGWLTVAVAVLLDQAAHEADGAAGRRAALQGDALQLLDHEEAGLVL